MLEVGSPLPPTLRAFGRYELIAKLANGGMAELFLARRPPAQADRVVIKRVLPFLAEDERFVAMFRDEARVAARIDHANVCKVLEVGTVGDVYFMALEYLHGLPLSRLVLRAMHQERGLDGGVAAAIGMQAALGLHAAHELTAQDGRSLEVVHRDVSPPNLFITATGVVKVLDFGVAKAKGATQKTRTGMVKGKNAYMSPEQVLGSTTIDRRSDVFSLGICLWEALAARRLFNRDNDFMTLRAIADSSIPPLAGERPDLPPALVAVVNRCLAHSREDRYPTAQAVAIALAAAVELAQPPTLAAFLAAEFADELAAKAAILRAAV